MFKTLDIACSWIQGECCCGSLKSTLLLHHRRQPQKLRSADTRTLLVNRTLTTFGDRAVSAAKPLIWNNLPTGLRQQDLHAGYGRFKQSLKTFFIGLLHKNAVWTTVWNHCRIALTQDVVSELDSNIFIRKKQKTYKNRERQTTDGLQTCYKQYCA